MKLQSLPPVTFQVVDAVDKSWNIIRRIPNYEQIAGEILFRKIFDLAPGALGMYQFGKIFQDASEEQLYKHPVFINHAKGVVQMLDIAINLLGPDLEPVIEALKDLGARHVEYGVLPAHYSIVGEALLYTLETALGEHWTDTVKQGWIGVYTFVSTAMMDGAEEYLIQRIQEEEEKKIEATAAAAEAAKAEEDEAKARKKEESRLKKKARKEAEEKLNGSTTSFASSTTRRRREVIKRSRKSLDAILKNSNRNSKSHQRRGRMENRGIIKWIDRAMKTLLQ